MKVLIIADSPSWAIGKLSNSILRYNKDIDVNLIHIHPREAETEESINTVKEALKDVNIVHFQYWNTAQKLIKAIPELKELKTCLTHHNQKNTLSEDWNALSIDEHIVHTQKNKNKLIEAGYKNVTVIQHGINLSYFRFNDKLPTEDRMFGYVGRICPWKGMKEIAKASREIGYKTLFMGKLDKPDYWNEIAVEDKMNLYTEFMDCKDSERVEAYHLMNVYVGNSNDGREEGTLGLLEAMACGVPVVTTPSGEAEDLCKNEYNALVVPFEDYEALKKAMNRLMNDNELANKLRQNAWNTVKNLTAEKMALQYRRLYMKMNSDNEVLVTVIIPFTSDRKEMVEKIKNAYAKQTYKYIEVLAIEDNEDGYNLAKCRNYGALEASGSILLFNDSRLLPENDVVERIVAYFKNTKAKIWVYGNKDGACKNTFVENFSAIRREHFIRAGMCAEWIDCYGAMSQELRERFNFAGFNFELLPEVHCTTMCKSSKTQERRQDIIKSKFKLYKLGLN